MWHGIDVPYTEAKDLIAEITEDFLISIEEGEIQPYLQVVKGGGDNGQS